MGDVKYRKNQCLSDIEELDRREESRGLAGKERVRRGELREELERLVEMEETTWHHKSRIKWLKKEDKCTHFFHRVTNSNRRNNSINMLKIDGITFEDPQEIGTQMVSFYQNLYQEQFDWTPE